MGCIVVEHRHHSWSGHHSSSKWAANYSIIVTPTVSAFCLCLFSFLLSFQRIIPFTQGHGTCLLPSTAALITGTIVTLFSYSTWPWISCFHYYRHDCFKAMQTSPISAQAQLVSSENHHLLFFYQQQSMANNWICVILAMQCFSLLFHKWQSYTGNGLQCFTLLFHCIPQMTKLHWERFP